MATLIKTVTVLRAVPSPRRCIRFKGAVERPYVLEMSQAAYGDLGYPHEITVTIESGDRLNDDAEGD